MWGLKHSIGAVIVGFAWLAAAGLAGVGSDAQAQTIHPRMATNTPRLQLFQGDGTNFMLVDPLFYEIKRSGKTITVPCWLRH